MKITEAKLDKMLKESRSHYKKKGKDEDYIRGIMKGYDLFDNKTFLKWRKKKIGF